MLRVWKLFPLKFSPRAYDVENLVYPRIPWFVNTVWMIQYSKDFLNYGWSFHELPMWPMVLITDKSIGMRFTWKWSGQMRNVIWSLSEGSLIHSGRRRVFTFLRNGGWWDVVLKVLCEKAHSLHQLRTGSLDGVLSSGGKTEVFQPHSSSLWTEARALCRQQYQNRIPGTAIQMTQRWWSNTDLF